MCERLGGKKGEVAEGDKFGQMFEVEFEVPGEDDMYRLEEFLANLGTHAQEGTEEQEGN